MQTFRRSAFDVPLRQLAHRTVRVLISPEDGAGDLSIALARFAPGIAYGHVHSGGEATYIISGEGRLRVDGIPLLLQPGIGAFAPPCLEHHVENDLETELVLIGAVCPSAVPGSYPDMPPRLQRSGKLTSVEAMHRQID